MSMLTMVLMPIIMGILLYKAPLKISRILLLLVQGYLGLSGVFLLRRYLHIVYGVNPLGLFGDFREGIMGGGPLLEIMGGTNPILTISLRGDRLSLLLVIMTVMLFTAAFLYMWTQELFTNRLILLLLMLQGAIIGILLTDDLFNLFILFEVAMLIITILICFDRSNRIIYDGLYYFIVQSISMLFFLLGIAYIYRMFGMLSMSTLAEVIAQAGAGLPNRVDLSMAAQSSITQAATAPTLASDQLVLPISLLLTGLAVKIGAFPLSSWVSRAYGAPSAPIGSLALQSAVFIKACLFQLIRINEMFAPVLDYTQVLLWLAIVTSIAGFIKALAQKDMILILAYHTVSQVGLMAVGMFLGEKGFWGGMYHNFNHSAFKFLLFLCAGIIAKCYGTRNVTKVHGVMKALPWVGIPTLVGILAITGAPFFNGSFSKYWIMASSPNVYVTAALWVINMGTILSFAKFGSMLFGGGEQELGAQSNVLSRLQYGVLWAFALICFLLGILALPITRSLFGVSMSVDLWGYIEKGLIYIVMMAAGILFYKKVLSKSLVLYRAFGRTYTVPHATLAMVVFFIGMMAYGLLST